jgi:hypothetical protein
VRIGSRALCVTNVVRVWAMSEHGRELVGIKQVFMFMRLGSVAGPVIQATGKSTFEDGLRLGGFGSDFK